MYVAILTMAIPTMAIPTMTILTVAIPLWLYLLWLYLLYHRCLPRITFPKLDIGNHSQPGNVAVVAGWGHLADDEGDDTLAGVLPDELHSSMVKPDQLPATYNATSRRPRTGARQLL